MDFKLFFTGVGFLIAGYLMYNSVKNDKPSSEETNWEGPTLSTYIGVWGSVILCTIGGIAFIFKSLPAQI
jgi:hypothetical protein